MILIGRQDGYDLVTNPRRGSITRISIQPAIQVINTNVMHLHFQVVNVEAICTNNMLKFGRFSQGTSIISSIYLRVKAVVQSTGTTALQELRTGFNPAKVVFQTSLAGLGQVISIRYVRGYPTGQAHILRM
jgi:hypothetical protein